MQTTPRPGAKSSQTSASHYSVELPYPEELQGLLGSGYLVESFLGQGGMGAVYKGLQMPLKRPVAIKILQRKAETDDFGFEERFKREAYAMAALIHPHIVQVYDCGDAGENFLFISMELVEGGDLSDAIKAGKVTPEIALNLIPQICDGLQAAHERGIVHRDIKPANIFLTKEGRAKVADFGLAKKFDVKNTLMTKTGLGMGTPDYAAPEQYEGVSDIDHRADIYALGVMMYQMLTGSLPRGNYRPASQRAGIDSRIDAILGKAMENERADRYQSAAEIKEAFAAVTAPLPKAPPQQRKPATASPAQATRPRSANPLPRTAVPVSSSRRIPEASRASAKKKIIGMIAMGGAIVVIAAGIWMITSRRSEPAGGIASPTDRMAGPLHSQWDPLLSRAAAEHALKLGATIIAETGGKRTTGKVLPADKFRLMAVSWPGGVFAENATPATMPGILQARELETLSLLNAENALNGDVCRLIAQLPNLKSVSFQQTNVKDEWLKPIGGMSSLTSINFASTALGDAGLVMLSGLRNLVHIDANNTFVSMEALSKVPWIGQLKKLSYGRTNKTLDEQETRKLFESAGALEILLLNAGAKSLAGIGQLRRLQELTLPPPITAEHLQNLATVPSLTTLTLKDSQVADDVWRELPTLKQLKTLKLTRTPATPALHAALKNCHPQLKLEVTEEPKGPQLTALPASTSAKSDGPVTNSNISAIPGKELPGIVDDIKPTAAFQELRKRGGRLLAQGTMRGIPVDIAGAPPFEDFVEVYATNDGCLARRANGEAFIWTTDGTRIFSATDSGIKSISSGTATTYLTEDGRLKMVQPNGIEKKAQGVSERSVFVAGSWAAAVAFDQDGIMVAGYARGVKDAMLPADFFRGAIGCVASPNTCVGLYHDQPPKTWNWRTGTSYVFPIEFSGCIQGSMKYDSLLALRKHTGQVFVSQSNRPNAVAALAPPPDLPPAIRVRVGGSSAQSGTVPRDPPNGICAAQMTDGTWRAWGMGGAFIQKIHQLGIVIDLDMTSHDPAKGCLIWIEPKSAP